MFRTFLEIISGFKKTLKLIGKREKLMLILASFLMLINGVLTNLPAVILGRLVDKMVGTENIAFNLAVPFISLIVAIILTREALTILRKYLVENIATQTEKKQTVAVINHLLKTDISVIHESQIGSLHGKIFRSIQGLVRVIKLGFLDGFVGLVESVYQAYHRAMILTYLWELQNDARDKFKFLATSRK